MKIYTRYFLEADDGNGSSNSGGSTLLGGAASNASTTTQTTQQTAQQQNNPHAVDDSGTAPRFDFRSALDDKGAFKPGWEANLPADLKDSATALAKYPTLEQAMRGLANAQKLIGQRQNALKAPAPDAPAAEHEKYQAALREALSIPADAKDYKIPAPEKLPEGVKLDDAKLGEFSKLAHSLNIPASTAQKLVEFQAKELAAIQQQGKATLEGYVKEQAATLKTEWGDKLESNLGVAKKAAEKLGLDVNAPELGNNAAFIKAMFEASKLMQPDALITGNSSALSGDGKAQAEDIRNNPNNPWHKAYHGKEGPVRQKEAQATMFRLLNFRPGAS